VKTTFSDKIKLRCNHRLRLPKFMITDSGLNFERAPNYNTIYLHT